MPESSTIIANSIFIPDEKAIVRVWSSVGYLSDELNGMGISIAIENDRKGNAAEINLDLPLLTLRSIADAIYNAIDHHEERQQKFNSDYKRQVEQSTRLLPFDCSDN